MNGRAYTFEKDTLNLILFADAASFNKSGNRSMWAIFSTIVELPPRERSLPENIIFHSCWTGSINDFNVYLSDYNKEIDYILENGVKFDGTIFRIKIHLFIADAPARAKACNSNQFNGKFGCLKCLHPTIHSSTTIYPSLKQIQKYEADKNMSITTTIGLRDHTKYLSQVKLAEETDYVFEGIKGKSKLADWIRIPDAIYLDKMHMCDIGSFKTIFNNFFEKKNKREPFYLG